MRLILVVHSLSVVTITLFLMGCSGSPSAPPQLMKESQAEAFSFEDITTTTGFNSTYRNGRESKKYAILESLGGSGGVIDFDVDGIPDIFTTGGGEFAGEHEIHGLPNKLHRGKPGLKWQDCTEIAGCGPSQFFSHGCAIADMDNDGFKDILVTGYGGLQLWRNSGDGTFESVSHETGLEDALWSTSAGWADFNGDGSLDLYVAHYVDWSFENDPVCRGTGPDDRDVCPPREFQGLGDILFLSDGAGGFRKLSREAGLLDGGNGLGVLLADVDHDGDVDIYVANDTTPNFLYLNDGRGNFNESGLASGVAMDDRGQPDGSMGVSLGDFDADGLPDLWVTNFEMETFALYRNQGNAQFQHISRDTGVMAIGSLYVGFGTVACDFDLDGDEDIAVINGHVVYYPENNEESQPPLLLENLSESRFQRVIPGPESGYFHQKHIGRGLLTSDFDLDGRTDLVAIHTNQPASLLRNSGPAKGLGWRIRLIGNSGNRDAVGARVVLHTSAGDQLRHSIGGGSYLSASDKLLTWGTRSEVRVTGATVTWPGGATQTIPAWSHGEILTIHEGR